MMRNSLKPVKKKANAVADADSVRSKTSTAAPAALDRTPRNLNEFAETIIRSEAYVKPFENILNDATENPKEDKRANGSVATVRIEISPYERLQWRHAAMQRRRRACIASLVFALLGILLMVVLNEWTFYVNNPNSGIELHVALVLRCLIVLATAALLSSVLAYHVSDLQLDMFQSGIDDWRVALTATRILKMAIESLICSVCPIPGNFYFLWSTEHHDGVRITTSSVPVDVLLSIPMFLRFYLVSRVLLLCMPIFSRTATRVVAQLNRVRLTLGFVVKALVTLYPEMSLLVFTTTYIMSASYIVRLCERYHYMSNNGTTLYEAKRFTNYLNNVWYIGITFLTVGYGDIVVNTYCGRAVSLLSAAIGVSLTALIINVVATKMKLSDGDTRLFHYAHSHHLDFQLRRTAANVVRETWFIYKLKRNAAKEGRVVLAREVRILQRRFARALHRFRHARLHQAKINPIEALAAGKNNMEMRVEKLERNFDSIQPSLQEFNTQLKEIAAGLQQLLPGCSHKFECDRLQLPSFANLRVPLNRAGRCPCLDSSHSIRRDIFLRPKVSAEI